MLSKVTLSHTDLSVSRICYGTNMLGSAIDQGRSNAILDKFLELGGNFLDTARMYGDWDPNVPTGASERALGAWLKGKKREDVVIATKGGNFDMRAGDFRNRVNPADIAIDLEESLGHLGIDMVDFYWVHMDNPETPVGELIDFLNEMKDAGKIGWFGASNWSDARVLESNEYAKAQGKTGFAAVQPFWGYAKPNEEAAAAVGYQLYFEDHGGALRGSDLAVIPYGSQSRGYFGFAEKGELPDHLTGIYDNPANKDRFAAAKKLADKHGVSVSDVALAYLLNQSQQVIPIVGASSPERIEESVKAASLILSPEEVSALKIG